jgi:tRNA threonylcarbamoyladenosine biosynthesis protein TsaE
MTSIGREWRLADATATRMAGRAIAAGLVTLSQATPLLITLHGELGAGKTTLVSGLLTALGFDGPVRSPTYTLIEPYELAGRQFYHLDLYRLTDPMQLEELGVRDLMQPGAVLLVEWPERAGAALATTDLSIYLSYPVQGADGRTLRLEPSTENVSQLVHSLTF